MQTSGEAQKPSPGGCKAGLQDEKAPPDVSSDSISSYSVSGDTVLGRMREVARTREIPRAQSDVLALAVLKYNLLMRGPSGLGKRWIARHAAQILELQSREKVETMSKWFNVTPDGITIDPTLLPAGLEQIRRATVLIIEHVPSQPHAAAAFFAHLDFICRVERCKPAASIERPKSAFSMDRPEQASFGGLQILATQNEASDAESDRPTPQIVWSQSLPTSAAGGLVKQTAQTASQLGVLIGNAAPPTSNPHHDITVVLFR